MKVRELIENNNLDVPGFDIAKTGIFIVFNLLLLFLVTDNPILNLSETEAQYDGLIISDIQNISKVSLLLIILNIILIVSSGAFVIKILELKTNELNNYICLFYAKVLLNLSILIFFLVICLWVIFLGGVRNSPYATLLSMSPILLSIQLFRDNKINEDRILDILSQSQTKTISFKERKKWNTAKRLTRLLSIIPLVVIVVTLAVGYYDLNMLKVKIVEIANTIWFSRLYFIIYYTSVLIAVFGVFPREWTNNISKRIF